VLLGGFLFGLSFGLEDAGDVSPKRRLTSIELHSVITQKTVLFIVIAVTVSNKIYLIICDYNTFSAAFMRK
jgi:hypothetical protein